MGVTVICGFQRASGGWVFCIGPNSALRWASAPRSPMRALATGFLRKVDLLWRMFDPVRFDGQVPSALQASVIVRG